MHDGIDRSIWTTFLFMPDIQPVFTIGENTLPPPYQLTQATPLHRGSQLKKINMPLIRFELV